MLVPRQYLGAFKCGHRDTAKEFIDEELSRDLLARIAASQGKDRKAVEALTYLTKFNNEFHKNVIKKHDLHALHSTDKLRKDLYSRENARNRDVLSRHRAHAISLDDPKEPEALLAYENYVDQLIEHLDDPQF